MNLYDKENKQVNLVERKDLNKINNFIEHISIPENGDVNDYIYTGIYQCNDKSNVINLPVSPNGILLVFRTYYSVQIYVNYEGTAWIRMIWDKPYEWKRLT